MLAVGSLNLFGFLTITEIAEITEMCQDYPDCEETLTTLLTHR
jgi:hypothetical protein